MNRKFHLLCYILAMLNLLACKLVDPPEKIPTYLYIQDIQVNTSTLEGTSNDNITDAWVYVNGKLIGIYEIPAKVPVIADGNYLLQIFGGIKNSGFVAQRSQYPFYRFYETTKSGLPNEIDTIIPVLSYVSEAKIWMEDFEDPGIKFSSPANSDTTIIITSNPSEVREGNGSGKITLNATESYFEIRTSEPDFNTFKKFGSPIYLELEYNSNYPFTVGLYHADNTTSLVPQSLLTLNPTFGEWKKIYIDYTEIVSTKTNSNSFQLYINTSNNNTNNISILLDNIKVVYL